MERIRALEPGADWRMSLEMREAAQKLARRVQEFDAVLFNAHAQRDPNGVAMYLVRENC